MRRCIQLAWMPIWVKIVVGRGDRVVRVHLTDTETPWIAPNPGITMTCGASRRDSKRLFAVDTVTYEERVLMRAR